MCSCPHGLFNLFLNYLVPFLNTVGAHSPKLKSLNIPILLHADDMLLLSRTRIGLTRLISACNNYLTRMKLTMNYDKSKTMVFGKSCKIYKWVFGGKPTQQVHEFSYLGVPYHHRLSWSSHRLVAVNFGKLSMQAIMHFLLHIVIFLSL